MPGRMASTERTDDATTTMNDVLRMHVVHARPAGWIEFGHLHELVCDFALVSREYVPSRDELRAALAALGFGIEVVGRAIIVHGISPADPRS